MTDVYTIDYIGHIHHALFGVSSVMIYKMEIKTLPDGLPVSVAECKAFMRREASFTDDDIMIRDALIRAEATRTETNTARKLLRQTWVLSLGNWWSTSVPLDIPFGELSVVEIRYTDYDGVQSVWTSTNYEVFKGNRTEPGNIMLAQEKEFPSDTLSEYWPIEIEFECGFYSGSVWDDATAYTLGDIVIPTTENGLAYECTVAGTSGGTEPTFPLTIGGTVVDNTVTWMAVGETVPYALKRAIMIGVCDAYDQPGDILLYPNKNLLEQRRLMLETWRLH